SSRHLMSVADRLIDACRKNGLMPLGVEGQGISDWIVVDLGDAIVHIMQDESRRMYELEKLWS
ncbi:ribosome silencing factor, partial [Vibrio parahaemolyticus]